MDKEFEKYLKKVSSNDVEYYSPYLYSLEDSLKGYRSKHFARITGEIFRELFDELRKNPNCSYDTYMNDVIKSGYNPKFISVLCKNLNDLKEDKNRYKLGNFADVIASKILNFFECPTTFELFLDLKDVDNKRYSCSVDFGRLGEDFYIIDGIAGIHSYTSGIHVDVELETIDAILKKFRECKMKEISDFEFNILLNKFKDNYVYSWLIRYLIMNDRDFDLHNVGLIYNEEENSIRMAPNFDLEMCFTRLNLDVETSENLNSLKHIAFKYPNVLKKFTKKLQELQRKSKGKSEIRNLVERVVGNDSENSEQMISDLQKRVKKIDKIITGMSQDREKL